MAATAILGVISAHDSALPGVSTSGGTADQHMSTNFFGPLQKITDYTRGCMAPLIESNGTNHSYKGTVNVVIGLNPSNDTLLHQFLSALSNPSSPLYHKYLTREQFDSMFGGSMPVYQDLAAYLHQNGVTDLQEFSDRMEISFTASSSQINNIFGISLSSFSSSIGSYFAPVGVPSLPAEIAGSVSGIAGLSNYSVLLNEYAPLALQKEQVAHPLGQNVTVNNYPIPVNSTSAQYLFGSDMQIALQEKTLFDQFGYPTNMVEATILWSGEYNGSTKQITSTGGLISPGTYVGPFVPSDIYTYYNETLPPGEPHSKIYAYPINGAPLPGIRASYDSTGAYVENTLDLEMLGSTAPGSSIYNVYGNNASTVNLVDAFSSILNPLPAYSALDNVSVISNSWGGTDRNCSIWYNDLQEANARGITVLASSGDDADSPSSSEYIGSNVSFPASMAYNNFGMVAVGGVSVTLNQSLQIASETNWYEPGSITNLSTVVGTTSGISSVFPEPDWQVNSSANSLIQGQGRGVPDISALANNTIMTITVSGFTYDATNASQGYPFEAVAGTSIASPLLGGVIAEIDHSIETQGTPSLGFLDPTLYSIGTAEYNPISYSGGIAHYGPTAYNTSLANRPYRPVIFGQNTLYTDRYGYSLLNGWGTINAYNFTSFVINDNFTIMSGLLSGVSDEVNLSNINATSYLADGTIFSSFNASIQQTFFLASSLGTPAFFVQAILQISGINETGFAGNFSLQIETPYIGLFPDIARYEYKSTSIFIPWAKAFNITSMLDTTPGYLDSSITSRIGSATLSLHAPGASYIIGRLHYDYFYGDSVVSIGPNGQTGNPGTFSPHFLVTGALAAKAGVFGPGTGGSVVPLLMPFKAQTWVAPDSSIITLQNTQTGSIGANIAYSPSGNGTWIFNYLQKSLQQGISSYVKGNYVVKFNETGLPSGTTWHVNILGLPPSPSIPSNGSYSANVTDGPYQYSAYASNLIYAPTDNGTFIINGENLSITLHFEKKLYRVTFMESGLPSNVTWSLNIKGIMSTGQILTNTVSVNLTNGTYSYNFSRSSNIFTAAQFYGTFTVNGSAISVPIQFFELKYSVSISESGLPANQNWTILFNGVKYNLSSIPLVLSLTNGSYNFTVYSVPGYRVTQPTGTFVVSGSAAYLVIEFTSPRTLEYEIEFVVAIIAMVLVASFLFYLLVRKKV
ncbi:MAG: S53 family peptidase [Thermoplasmata archaeon]